MGVEIERWRAPAGSQDVALTLQPPEDPLQPLNLDLPGDISSAAFLIVAALITPESEIVLRDVGLNPTRTGLLDTLREMGADIEIREEQDRHGEPVGTLVVRSCTLRGAFVDGPRVVRMIDEFPAFAVAAARADGPTEIRDAAELRHKESDRIRAIHQGLSALGAAVQELPDGLDLPGGGRFKGGTVRSFGDHRLAMALAVTGLVADSPVVVEHAEIISESFPGFVEILKSLGARMRWARPIHEKE
jgi:3-phosphoshikimate 1-carboxyvinyltransferase